MTKTSPALQTLAGSSHKISMEFFAACAIGLEKLVGDELRAARIKRVRPLSGGVSFGESREDAEKAIECSRVASRILQTVARFEASDANSLYAGVKDIAWEEYIAKDCSIAIHARGTNENLRDTRFIAMRAKDAICDRLRELRGVRPDVNTKNPDVSIVLVLRGNKVLISLDLSGAMHKRGYRVHGQVEAPLRETLAAAMLRIAGVDKLPAGTKLMDPMCGSGTIAIEAALMNPKIKIIASDIDDNSIAVARKNAQVAGVYHRITFSTQDIVANKKKADVIVTNPPYGQRLSSLAQLPALYSEMRLCFERSGACKLVLISSDKSIDGYLHLQAQNCIKTYNGPLESAIRSYDLSKQPHHGEHVATVRDCNIPILDAGAQQFASRLNKVVKQREKWAKENQIFAYRVYDADLPDYNLAIDVYDCAEAGRRIHVAEYAAPKAIAEEKTRARLTDALAIIRVVFDVPVSNIYCKQRCKSKGGSQYGKDIQEEEKKPVQLVTCENRLLFEVNLSDYLDTGLFIDHRKTRNMIRVLAKDKSFLNLFAYTGSATVYAASGGAKSTTTVDISNTYLDWAKRNLELNKLSGENNEFVRADVLIWAQEKRHSKDRWDLIFIDPPTFSNSSKMGKRTWDIQRDHAELLICASRLLMRGGAIVFSCNLRKFKLDKDTLEKAGVRAFDITEKTIPEDFSRNQNIHHCYILQRA